MKKKFYYLGASTVQANAYAFGRLQTRDDFNPSCVQDQSEEIRSKLTKLVLHGHSCYIFLHIREIVQ